MSVANEIEREWTNMIFGLKFRGGKLNLIFVLVWIMHTELRNKAKLGLWLDLYL